MTTRTQIIEGLRFARHKHTPGCNSKKFWRAPDDYCDCGADDKNKSIDAAIAELEKKAVQAEPSQGVVYPDEKLLNKWREEFEEDNAHCSWGRALARKTIDWYRSQHPAPKPADEQTVGDDPVTDYIIGLRRQIYMAENTILELQKRLDTPRPADPDLLALVDELEKAALLEHDDDMDVSECPAKWKVPRPCDCGADEYNTKVRELTARLRAACHARKEG